MTERAISRSNIATMPGRFHRAQGGWCDFRPEPGIATPPEGRDPTPRTVYPSHPLRPRPPESWVRLRG